tara:strand:+ start:1431 stop:1862 length:432 start_codon:yes stop_codon:yes gene_type:complete
MEARKLKRPNVGECQEIYDRYSINDSNHTGTTTDLCAVIHELEQRLEGKNQLETLVMWRSVEDELPPIEKPVWLSDGLRIWVGGRTHDEVTNKWLWGQCHDNQFWFSGFIGDGDTLMWDGDIYVDDAYNPTHWQFLPKLPQAT